MNLRVEYGKNQGISFSRLSSFSNTRKELQCEPVKYNGAGRTVLNSRYVVKMNTARCGHYVKFRSESKTG